MKNWKQSGRLVCLLAAAALLAGCGDDGDYSKYVTLGDYTGLNVELVVEEVTEEELEEYEQEYLSEYQSYHYGDGPIEEGQYVELSLVAKTKSEVLYDFEDGYEMIVGDEEFGAEVDELLIGKSVGDEMDITVTHDADFEDFVLAGNEVSYHIEVMNVADVVTPDLTDAFVAENFDEESVEAWRQTLYEELYSSHEADATEDMRDDLLQQAVDGSEISGYPKSLYKQQKELIVSDYQSYADMFGCSLEDIYDMFEMDKEAREEEYLNATYQVMVLALIQEQEGITLSDEELAEQLEEFAEYNEYDSVDELLEDYSEEELKEYFLQELTIDFLEEHANVMITTAAEEQ